MNISIPSYVAGPFFLALFFAFSLITVAGIKTVVSAIVQFFKKPVHKPQPAPEPKKPAKPKPKKQRTAKTAPKPIRSIEINPEEVDRIYVRKSV